MRAMTKSRRLKPVQQLSESREQDAARALGSSNQAVQEQERRLAELEQYRDEYYKYVQEKGAAGVMASKLLELQRFLNNLNQAIEQQRQMVELARQEREQKKHSWQQAHGKSQAMNKVVDRYRQEEQFTRNKREQKEIDEHAQSKGRGKG
jgi:flagellar FliJ protein